MDYNEPFDSLLSRIIPARVNHDLEAKKTAPRDIQICDLSDTLTFPDTVQGSHTDTLMEVARDLSNHVHPAQILILGWKTREESFHGSSNDKVPIREYVL